MPRDFPSYRRHPNGQGFCKYKGKSYYFGRYELDTSRQDYERFRARMLSGLGVVTQPAPSHNGPIIELIAEYREHARRRYCRNGAATREFDNVMLALRR